MKTAVSIPDNVFAEADSLAQQLNKSRSEVYSLALAEYIARHSADRVVDAMNRVCADIGAESDDFTATAAQRIMERSQW